MQTFAAVPSDDHDADKAAILDLKTNDRFLLQGRSKIAFSRHLELPAVQTFLGVGANDQVFRASQPFKSVSGIGGPNISESPRTLSSESVVFIPLKIFRTSDGSSLKSLNGAFALQALDRENDVFVAEVLVFKKCIRE